MKGGEERSLLGTDIRVRYLLGPVVCGLRVSLIIGWGTVLVQPFIGIIVGLFGGYFSGKPDAFLMRIADILFSIP